MNRILFEADELNEQGMLLLSDHRAEHVHRVLRSRVGDKLRVGQVNGPLGEGTVVEMDRGLVKLRCELGQRPPLPRVDLLLATPRPKVMRRLWAQLSAVGVGRILLCNAKRVERCYFDTHWLEPATTRRCLLEGLSQAGDTSLPEVQIHRRFRVLVEDVLPQLYGDETARLVAHPGGAGELSYASASRVLLAVGPEGGWVPFELELLREHGFVCFSLGWRTLRTDSACIALLSVINAGLGDNVGNA